MHYELTLGVPAIAVGLSALSLLALPFPLPFPVPDIRSQRMPLQSLTQGGCYNKICTDTLNVYIETQHWLWRWLVVLLSCWLKKPATRLWEILFITLGYWLPFRCYSDKYLKVDTWHRSRQYRKIFFVKKIVDCSFERYISPFERDFFFQSYVAHKILWQLSCECDIVRRHCISLWIIAPFIEKRPSAPR